MVGFFYSTLDSEPGTKAKNFAGEIWSCKLILKQAEKPWFGWHKREQDSPRIGRFTPATFQSENICHGNRAAPSPIFQDF